MNGIFLWIMNWCGFGGGEEETKDLYEEGLRRPVWSPEVLYRMLFLEYYSNLSDVQVSEQCVYNLLYRWFGGLRGKATLDNTTLVVFRRRLGQGR